jgi:hypothetical protein
VPPDMYGFCTCDVYLITRGVCTLKNSHPSRVDHPYVTCNFHCFRPPPFCAELGRAEPRRA